ncbi:MAG: glycosyltransferase family 2 protein [Muribaculaceae bacterium]|nr:glycosyltransferase family 2 protein [Muribaculaceae bacterium]
MNDFTTGIIISTYNNPRWLEKTLWGYMSQTVSADEIIIADDGSDDSTRSLIEKYASVLPIRHVWHEDLGFRKTKILNEAIKTSTADYLIFTDQDCVPRHDFVETHLRFARRGHFLSGGYFKLPMDISECLTQDDIASGAAFTLSFLLDKGLKKSFKITKLFGNSIFASVMNAVTPARASWNGMNSSGWRDDIARANGFDERMQYGGEDRELGERLVNAGIKPVQIRYSAITLHLDHKRPYVNDEAWARNDAIRRETRRRRLTRTAYGITKD